MFVVTHQNPDFDAIAATWLLLFHSKATLTEVRYVNTGNPDPATLAEAEAVVDTGKEYNPIRLRFDHHHLPGQQANDTCATMQVFDCLVSKNPTIEYLSPLIDLIFAGDTGRREADFSRELGIHALLSGFKAGFKERGEIASDQAIMDYGFGLLDTLALRLGNQATAKAELAEKVLYKSRDGFVWFIRHGSSGSSFAAFDEGARVVVFEGEPLEVEGGRTTYPVGMMRAGEWQEPHIGNLVEKIRQITKGCGSGTPELAIWDELGRWFLHPAGFFAGRGTAKAPVFEPVLADMAQVASFLDTEWQR